MPENDLISRGALKKELAPQDDWSWGNGAYVRDIIDSVPTVDRWISVKDRLPDAFKRVITYDKFGSIKENMLLKSKPRVTWSVDFYVTYWMPFPEPPKEDKQ